MNKIKSETIFQFVILTIFLSVFAIIFAQPIVLSVLDLGRHLKNGELFIQNGFIAHTNLFSYTFPDFPFINHHWGSGVIFYLVQQATGFTGLSLFYILIFLLTFLLFFRIAWQYSSFPVAILASLAILPIVGSRNEIRPEGLSYLFLGISFFLLWNYHRSPVIASEARQSSLWLLPLLQLIWINLHIFFILGLFLIGLFLAENLFWLLFEKFKTGEYNPEFLAKTKKLSLILLASLVASLINPFGLQAVLYPLNIFQNYGYTVFENQSVVFIDKIIDFVPSIYFKLAFALLSLSWIYVFYKRKSFSLSLLVISIAFSTLAWSGIRYFGIFGLFFLPIIAINFEDIKLEFKNSSNKNHLIQSQIFLAASVLLVFIGPNFWKIRINNGFSIGLAKYSDSAGNFLNKNNIVGPIFNDFDSGSYLDYYVYPREKVFIDNRPEAYPADFFQQVYIPMQKQNSKWAEVSKQYQFNTIVFDINSLADWGREFLVHRIDDPLWAPVYADNSLIIFLRRGGPNQDVIKKYEIPRSMFSVIK